MRGVAIGSVLSQFIALLIVVALFFRLKLQLRVTESFREFIGLIGKLLTLGIPTCVSNASFTLSQVITNSFAVLLGIHAASGKIYFTSILCYAYLFSSSVGNANALLVGRLFGAGNYEHARRLNRMLVRFTIWVTFWFLPQSFCSGHRF